MLRETGAAAFIRQQHAIMGVPIPATILPGIEIPTLILVGEADAITPPEIAREMAEMIEWASLIVVRGSGHLSALEEPERVTKALKPVGGRGLKALPRRHFTNNVASK